jgi:hypothetical protein
MCANTLPHPKHEDITHDSLKKHTVLALIFKSLLPLELIFVFWWEEGTQLYSFTCGSPSTICGRDLPFPAEKSCHLCQNSVGQTCVVYVTPLSCKREERIRDGNSNMLLTVRSDPEAGKLMMQERTELLLFERMASLQGTSGKSGLGSRVQCGSRWEGRGYHCRCWQVGNSGRKVWKLIHPFNRYLLVSYLLCDKFCSKDRN